MQRDNVEIVRRFFDAFNAGDYRTNLELLAPDVQYHELEGMPGARGMVGVYTGRDEVARWYTEFLGEWDPGFRSEPVELTELGDGRILVLEHWRGVAVQSRVEVEASATSLYTIRDGLVAEIRYFRTREEALEAVGRLP